MKYHDKCLLKAAKGRAFAHEIVTDCQDVVDDCGLHVTHPIAHLSSLTRPSETRKAEHYMHAYVRQNFDVGLEEYKLSLPFHIPEKQGIVWRDVYMILPHEFVGAVHSTNYSLYRELFFGTYSARDVVDYWKHALEQPQFLGNERVLDMVRGREEQCVPLRVHGDDVPVGKRHSMIWAGFTACSPCLPPHFPKKCVHICEHAALLIEQF